MKKAFRIIVPIILAIAVVGCMIWYLFVYDREFTRDILLQQARNFESKGSHEVAEWFYNAAYSHANNDENVAIELANQYKASGNYTKAEYTLSNAIADGGTAELYIALCKTYVEQDKLLDAVRMLDNIADPAIKAELDAQRPGAPTASPEPGFYSQYISVELTSSDGTLYVRTDGQYPSIEDNAYSEPITLDAGETTIYALCVGEDGLVSPLSVYGYTVGGVIEEVAFTDAAFEAEVRSTLGVDEDKVLYTNELWTITEFTMPAEAGTYEDLKFLPYLESLTIEDASSDELSAIGTLSSLKSLTVTGCSITGDELSAISALPLLQSLTLQDCSLANIDALENAQSLTYLDLSENSIRNITTLTNLSSLQTLNMAHNALTDLSALSGLNSLTSLDVSYNSLTSIAPICVLKNITVLNVTNNSLSDLSLIENLTGLTELYAGSNSLTSIGQLSSCKALVTLDLSANLLTDISAVASLSNLQYLTFSNNQISSLPAFDTGCALIKIDGESNLISDLEPLRGLENLNYVYMRFNEEISSVSPLADCPVLVEVDVWGTKVTEVSSLTSQSILVTYDPTLGKVDNSGE